MVNRRNTRKKNTRKRNTRKRNTHNNVGGIPVRRYAAALATLAAAVGTAAMYGVTRGRPHMPGTGHTIADVPTRKASGSKKRTKKGARKTRGKKGRSKSKRR